MLITRNVALTHGLWVQLVGRDSAVGRRRRRQWIAVVAEKRRQSHFVGLLVCGLKRKDIYKSMQIKV